MGYTPHVLVIGGGVVGTGIARDLAIRGLEVTLVERGTLAAGTTGRTLGVLYSGARVTDSERLAQRIHRENQILREIADHCVEDTGGLLVTDDTGSAFDEIRSGIEKCSIPHDVLDGDDLQETEEGLSPNVERAISVPDAVADPFELALANARSAREYGASIRTHTAVTDISVDGGTIGTVTVEHDPTPTNKHGTVREARADGGRPGTPGASESKSTPGTRPGEAKTEQKTVAEPSSEELDPDYVVNAAGGRAGEVAALAGLTVDLDLTAEATVLLNENPVETVVTRCSSVGPGETVAPFGQQAVLGTIRERVAGPDEGVVPPDGPAQLTDRLADVVPGIAGGRKLRVERSVRSSHPDAESDHEHALVDHGDQDGCWGMTTVAGGSLTTHRFAAEQVSDEVCSKFGIQRESQTDEIPLPSRTESPSGSDVSAAPEFDPILCECQSVTRRDVVNALADETGMKTDLDDVRIRSGATMGECQGGRCAHRIAAELYPEYEEGVVSDSLDAFLDSHWEGQRHALCGRQLEQAMRTYIVQVGTMNLPAPDVTFVSSRTDDVEEALEDEGEVVADNSIGLAAFDDGERPGRRERPTFGERSPGGEQLR